MMRIDSRMFGRIVATAALLAPFAALVDSITPDRRVSAADKPPAARAGEDPAHGSVWMKRKLEFSQNILGGIATADFDLIARNAEAMRGLGKIEGFIRGRAPGYKTQLDIFMQANDEILNQARKENVDGAALAFTQMTISCINCHKQLRDEKSR